MICTIRIGNAVLRSSCDTRSLTCKWAVDPVVDSAAPTFPYDWMVNNSNTRSQISGEWQRFCKNTGIYDIFYDDCGYFQGGRSGGCMLLRRGDLERIRQSRIHRESISKRKPGFNWWLAYEDEPGAANISNEDLYDTYLARLLWLEWWVSWALEKCETPAIEIY